MILLFNTACLSVTSLLHSYYEGDFVKEMRHGHGIYRSANGTEYDGDWMNGMMHGVGTLKKANGDKYVGEFKDGMKDGDGMIEYADGNRFVGLWIKGKRAGRGSYLLKARQSAVESELPEVLRIGVFGF